MYRALPQAVVPVQGHYDLSGRICFLYICSVAAKQGEMSISPLPGWIWKGLSNPCKLVILIKIRFQSGYDGFRALE